MSKSIIFRVLIFNHCIEIILQKNILFYYHGKRIWYNFNLTSQDCIYYFSLFFLPKCQQQEKDVFILIKEISIMKHQYQQQILYLLKNVLLKYKKLLRSSYLIIQKKIIGEELIENPEDFANMCINHTKQIILNNL